MTLPSLDHLRSLFHYNPLTGGFVYLQQRGPRRAGGPAGTTIRGIPHLYVNGAQHRAAAVAWALSYGADPSPQHVIPLDGDPLNLRLSNLALSDQPFTRSKASGRRRATRPKWEKSVHYRHDDGLHRVLHRGKIVGKFISRAEALAFKRALMKKSSPQDDA